MKALLFGLALGTALATTAAADPFHLRLAPRDGVESAATGTGMLDLDPARGEVTYDISVEGLSSPEIAAHIHAADGTVLHTLPLGSRKTGAWTGLGPVEIFQMQNEVLYVLVHTETVPAGEARGDIVAGPLAVEEAGVSALKDRYRDASR